MASCASSRTTRRRGSFRPLRAACAAATWPSTSSMPPMTSHGPGWTCSLRATASISTALRASLALCPSPSTVHITPRHYAKNLDRDEAEWRRILMRKPRCCGRCLHAIGSELSANSGSESTLWTLDEMPFLQLIVACLPQHISCRCC